MNLDLDFPDETAVRALVDDVSLPRFADVRYEPPAPRIDDVGAAAREAVDALPVDALPAGATVAVGLGSRGITDVVPVARSVVAELDARGFDPVVVPAMGSHGGATADGQREVLAAIGLTEDALGCAIDARMETTVVGEAAGTPVHLARAALEADATLVVNRVKPHTNFTGEIESGLCKMLTVGLGKQAGANAIHERALDVGYVPTIRGALAVLREATTILGGVAIVENFYDETARVAGVPADALPERESELLSVAREWMPTLPYDDIDVLVVDRIGKDVSGAGMDTNVVGRYRVLNADEPETPRIKRIVVRGLTEATHGHAQGLGLADLTTTDVIAEIDLERMYTNALTSSSLSKVALPIALPTDELAFLAALSTIGSYDPGSVRVAWIRDTAHLSSFRVSEALAEERPDHVRVESWQRLRFEDGEPEFVAE